jgi:hypothetical protein
MPHKKLAIPQRVLFLLVLVTLTLTVPLAQPAAAQAILTGPISPASGSNVRGEVSVAAGDQGAAFITVRLSGLAPRSMADVNLNAGTCSQPSASVLRLFTIQADDQGQVVANAPVFTPQGTPFPLAQLTDGNHVVVVLTDGRAAACGPVPVSGGNDLAAALLAEGERQQVMQFNPNAALQKRIFADGFVPNSAEFGVVVEATPFAVQRAEHLRTGAVRAYFVRAGDWGNVRFAQRGVSQDPLGLYMLAEAERHQAIRFNPTAALQRRIFADGFVPNSPEFPLQYAGINYTGQRAENLQTGRVRVYYAVTGQWNDVRFVQRGATAPPPNQPPPPPGVSISPTSGPKGTVVHIIGTNFGFNVGVTLWGGPVGSEGIQLATGVTDASGNVSFDVPMPGAAGMRWRFGIVAGSQHAESGEFLVTG